MSCFSVPNDSASVGPSGTEADPNWGDRKFILPRSWIYQDNGAERITLQVKLPGCTKDHVRVKMWNQRQLLVLAACENHHYELQYKIPRGARLLSSPTFASQTEILTCRFQALNPVCIICQVPFTRGPIVTKDAFASVLSRQLSEFIQPRHLITYDGKMALFEAHLEGCKNSSQINFHVANDKVMLLASLSPQRNYFLGLRLESSAHSDWKAYFDMKVDMFTCAIPLLGHFKCGKCMAKRHLNDAEGSSEEKAEKVLGAQMEEAISSGNPPDIYGRETKQSPQNKTAACEGNNFNLDLDFIRVKDQNTSRMKVFPNSETAV